MRTLAIFVWFSTFIISTHAFGATVQIKDAWVRQPMGGSKVTALFASLTNTAKTDDILVSAKCKCATATEVHRTTQQDGMMRMQRVQALSLKAGETVALKPGSYHIMLMGLTKPLKPNDTVKLTLEFEKAGVVTVDAKVKAP